MSYRDKKNPWHCIFDSFKNEHADLSESIEVFHPVEYPIIEVDLNDGTRLLYHGVTKKLRYINESIKNDFYKHLLDLMDD